MKKKLLSCLSLATLMSIGLSVAIFSGEKKEEEVGASSYSVNTVPTTIDLNDTTAADIRSYYSSLNNKIASERQGTNLLKNLKPILKNGQKYFSYGSGATTAVWQAYEIVDRDWNKSPASAISGYNSSTNIITGYSYGSSNSSTGSNPYVHALYVNRNVTNQTRAWGNHNQDQWGINQEHIWAKSCGFNAESPAAGARGDLMHLWAGNGRVNGVNHSNYYYGYVDTTKSYSDASSYASTLSGNRHGKSKTLGGSYTVFEPQDSDKGDIARALFYMAARYNYLSGSDSDGIDAGNPNLEIINELNWEPGTSYTSSTSTKGQMGILQDLLEWNRLDPPDEWEIHRNNLLYNNYTKNRNPFIDFPEWAEYIWGKSVNGSYSSTSTGSANPSSDTINDFSAGGGSTVSVTSVSVSPTSATIAVDGAIELTKTISPSNATNQNVTWTSSNTNVATVSNGVVTGKAAGNATITVTTVDGNKTATSNVTVKALSSISISGYTTEFNKGATFVFGGTVTAHYSDSSTADVTSLASYSGYNMNTPGTHTVTVSYGNKSQTYQITINGSSSTEETEDGSATISEGAATGWTAAGTGSKYSDGAIKFDTTGDYIYKLGIFSGDVSTYMTNLKVTINGKWNSGTGDQTKNSYKVEAISGTAGNITVKNSETKTGSSVFTSDYDDVDFEMSSSLSGTTGIRITYQNKSNGNWGVKGISWVATYAVPSGTSLTGITLDTSEVQTVFELNEEFNYNDLVVTANYSDSTSEQVDPDSVSTPDMSTSGNKTVTVTYSGQSAQYSITVNEAPVTSISAEVKNSKTFYVGETITKSDITVTTNTGVDVTNSATFSDYTFTYADADSGGSLTNKTFTNGVSYSTFQCSLTVQVQRKARESVGSVTDTLNLAYTEQSGSTYGSWEKSAPTSNASYSGHNAGSNSSIQFRTSETTGGFYSGIVSTVSGGNASSVEISWHSETTSGRTVDVYGKNTAYSSPNDLFSNNTSTQGTLLGSIVKGTSTKITITGSYTFIGLRSRNGALYISKLEITYGTDDSATNVANYIMYEDTNNQCTTKTTTAIGYFEGLSQSERTTFMTSNNYVIATARERFNAWLKHEGKSISTSGGDYIIKTSSNAVINVITKNFNYNTIIIVIVTSLGVLSIGGYFLFRRKKEQ